MAGVNMYDTVFQEEQEDTVEEDEITDILPPCEECEKHVFYRRSTFNVFDALFVVISLGTFVADIVTDTLVIVQYFNSPSPQYAWGSLTLAFTLGPSIVMQIFSASWYVADEDMTNGRLFIHLIQLAPVQRYIRVLRTGLEARKSNDLLDFQRLNHQQSDVSMLRLFEAFLESAPQVVLQLYIMVATEDDVYFTGIAAVVSLFSLCWAMVAYSKNHRKVRNDKNIMSIPGLILQTIWRIGMISSRVVALVLFATFFKAYLFVVAAIHWLCMAIWAYVQNTDFCDTWMEERIFNAVIGVIYIFCFFNLKEGNSRYRITIFYSVMFAENVILVTLWYLYKEEITWYDPVGFGVVFGGFALGITSMLLYYRFFHPRGSGAITLFIKKKSKDEDKHRLHQEDQPERRPRRSDVAEISRRGRTPSPRASPQNRQGGLAPMSYPITTRSLTPNKYSPLKSDSELPYDRYGMRRGQRSLSEACIDTSAHHVNMTTPTSRMGRVNSEQIYSQGRSLRYRSSSEKKRRERNSEQLNYSPDRSTRSRKELEFSGFATDLVKQFDSKLNRACATAMSSYSYNSYGFDVEAQNRLSQYDESALESEHKVMVHTSASQPDMRGSPKDKVGDQSSVLLEPMPETVKPRDHIKNAYEVKQMYTGMHGGARPKRTSKRQLMFGQSPSPPIKGRTQSPMCPHHQQIALQRSFSLPPARQQTWQESEIKPEPKQAQKVRRTPPKIPPRGDTDTIPNNEVQNKLKIPHDTSKAERAMLKRGEKRKFSFREKVPGASLKAMRFTPMVPKVKNMEPGSPVWKLHELNNRLWQPKTVDIYNPKLNQSPGKSKVVAQPGLDLRVNLNQAEKSLSQAEQSSKKFTFSPDSSNEFGNFYSIFQPKSLSTKAVDKTDASAQPTTSTIPTPNSTQLNVVSGGSINPRYSFGFTATSAPSQSSSSLKNSNRKKTENIYASIDENGGVKDHTYTDLGDLMYSRNQSSLYDTSGSSNGSGGSGSGGKKRKLSPRADLPQLELKPSQQFSQPVTPLTPSKSYRLADQHSLNSPHRHITSFSSERSKSRLEFAAMQAQIIQEQDEESLANPFISDTRLGAKSQIDSDKKAGSDKKTSSEQRAGTNNMTKTLESIPSQSGTYPTITPATDGFLKSALKKNAGTKSNGKENTKQSKSESRQQKSESKQRKSETKQQKSETKQISETKQTKSETVEKVSHPKSAKVKKQPEASSDGKLIKAKSQIETHCTLSNSLPVISDSQTRNTEVTVPSISIVKSSNTVHEDIQCSTVSEQSPASLEKQSPKSQSLPVIPNSDKVSQLKKEIKPKAHSDTRGVSKQQPQLTAVFRKPLGELQNRYTTKILNINSRPRKVSSNERLESRLPKSQDEISSNTSDLMSKRLSVSIESLMPLMQSTPALPDCRKLLRFESTGAKPKTRLLNGAGDMNNANSEKSKKKPLSPVENNSDEKPTTAPVQTTPAIAGSVKSASKNEIVIRTNPMSSSRIPTLERSLREKLGREKLGRLDLDLLRSGKENQHYPVARWFDIMSPSDSFISSLAFQNPVVEKRVPERRAPPLKPPRMSITKIPPNKVSDNVAKFSNGTDL